MPSLSNREISGREILEILRSVTFYLVLVHGEALRSTVPDPCWANGDSIVSQSVTRQLEFLWYSSL